MVEVKGSNIFVTGLPGAGKTSIGKKLSRLLGFGFLDLDDKIEKSVNCSISEYVARNGMDKFRQVERDNFQYLGGIENHVVSLGGGFLETAGAIESVQKMGRLVFVDVSPKEIAKRLYMSPDQLRKRPLLAQAVEIEAHEARLAFVEKKLLDLATVRRQQYERADILCDTSYSTQENCALFISKKIQAE